MFALVNQCGWSVQSVAIAFGLTDRAVRYRLAEVEKLYGRKAKPQT